MKYEDLTIKQVKELTQFQLDLATEKCGEKMYELLVSNNRICDNTNCHIFGLECNVSVDEDDDYTLKQSELPKTVNLSFGSLDVYPIDPDDDEQSDIYFAHLNYSAGLVSGPACGYFKWVDDKLQLLEVIFDNWNNPDAPYIIFR